MERKCEERFCGWVGVSEKGKWEDSCALGSAWWEPSFPSKWEYNFD